MTLVTGCEIVMISMLKDSKNRTLTKTHVGYKGNGVSENGMTVPWWIRLVLVEKYKKMMLWNVPQKEMQRSISIQEEHGHSK